MEIVSTTTIGVIDLINLSKDIAQLNLGYLGISVAILGVLGGVFVYFNIKPLKDTLNKQEKTIIDLREEADKLLDKSKEQTNKVLETFKTDQSESLDIAFKKQEEKLQLEVKNKVQEIKSMLSDEIEDISENKDLKLREIILSETNNRLGVLEKELISKTTAIKEDVVKESSRAKSANIGLKTIVKELDEKVKELQIYKHSKEGQMGAIIISIDLLKDSIDEYFEIKKISNKPNESFPEVFSSKPKGRLISLIKEIGDYKLEQEYISQIEEQLARIAGEVYFIDLVKQLKEKLGI